MRLPTTSTTSSSHTITATAHRERFKGLGGYVGLAACHSCSNHVRPAGVLDDANMFIAIQHLVPCYRNIIRLSSVISRRLWLELPISTDTIQQLHRAVLRGLTRLGTTSCNLRLPFLPALLPHLGSLL